MPGRERTHTQDSATSDELFDDELSDEIDFEFAHENTFLDYVQGTSLSELSIKLRNQLLKLKRQTDEWKQNISTKKDQFIDTRKAQLIRRIKSKKTVKLFDKFGFVLGISYIWITVLVLARFPAYMPIYYISTILPLVTYRWFHYKKMKWHYFLADLCYFVNGLLILQLFFIPNNKYLFSALFLLANGPVAWAIYAWRNALVFHSLDKMTSVVIHIAPPIALYALRWLSVSDEKSVFVYQYPSFAYGTSMDIGFLEAIGSAIVVYVIWQSLYYYFILVRKKHNVYGGTHATSYTWLLADYLKKKSASFLVKLFKYFSEPYRPFLFMFIQLLYAIATMAPAILYYNYFWIHTAFIFLLTMMSTFNGADYYFEVFSRRYMIELERLEEAVKKAEDSASKKNE
ncbi:hypothetical protein HK103_005674 [Boothiomyces macroporosus]|uniref:Glycerophosphocholine acyltransferase 1 n=1 Tax=Boothiomyces macroporosus TaxID=261099 RepID=A0AAD5Y372_9FUNG|nr:hypothetical protein HK103_005674 [Boothiomyces macroporosus]